MNTDYAESSSIDHKQTKNVEKKAVSFISKKRYLDFCDGLKEILNQTNEYEMIVDLVQDVFRFDPSKSQYDVEKGKKNRERLKERCSKENKTLYELGGRKNNYYKQKLKKKENSEIVNVI